ncbi:hypothetical protein JCM10295v2_001078 [Rhodotorula toruloides]
MSTNSFAGAPVSKVTVACSVLAAVTSAQHLFHLPLVPHLTRDHQFYRLVAHHFVFANSAELLLGTLLLWQTSAEVERLFGTRKFALYHFRLFHPYLTFSNRFGIYLLAALLFSFNFPSYAILGAIGIASSLAYISDFLSMRRYRISRRVYKSLARTGGLVFRTDDGTRIRRGTAVTAEEVLLQSLAAAQGGAAGAVGGGLDASALRGLGQRATQTAAEAAAAAPAAADAAEPAEAPPTGAPTAPTTPSRAPRMGFLRQWQAGLTGKSPN